MSSLDPSEKQKKILAAKKKLKSFQAKRAAATGVGSIGGDSPTLLSPTAANFINDNDDSSANGNGSGSGLDNERTAPQSEAGSPTTPSSREEEADVLAKELEQLKQQINRQREHLQAENQRTHDELQGCQERLVLAEVSVAATERDLREVNETNQAQLAERDAGLELAAQQRAQLEQSLGQRDADIAALRAAAEDASRAHSDETERLAREAQRAADTASAEMVALGEQMSAKSAELAACVLRAEAGEAQAAALDADKRALEAQAQDLTAALSDAQALLQQTQERLEQEQEAHAESVAALRAAADEQNAAHCDAVAQLNADISQRDAAHQKLSGSAAELEQQLGAAQAEISANRQRISELDSDLAHVGQVRDTIQAKHDKLAASQKESRKTIERTAKDLEKTKKELADTRKARDQLDTELAAAVAAHLAEKATLDAHVTDLQATISERDTSIAAVQSDLDRQTQALADLTVEYQKLQTQAAQLAADLDSATTAHATHALDLGQQLDEQTTARQTAEHALASAQSDNALLEEKNAKLAEELMIEAEAARETFEELLLEHADLEKKHQRLSAAHEKLADRHRKAIASTQAWITELMESSVRQKDEVDSWDAQDSGSETVA
ncbi:hypothetical protein BX661DRAFT_182841 [Kickxella alabastrina]|uniref:uncharacterized protein n=1 Tax=Kickxella alabastrina TaxID=61397 RepID=UPI00221F013F|nr:uncharacterized protein BX661DRAFT_182841 [Kickxella alabastrina]KAI7827192.1 hypothetical protein BX661DRAFT_182841 [Kickxella alabastrina]